MKAFIYVGGGICRENIIEMPAGEDIAIAADSGYLNAEALGVSPSILVGDLDSLGNGNTPKGVKLVKLPCEKDVTDAQAAVDIALEEGARDIVMIGGLDGRLDHTLSNLAILERLSLLGARGVITDGKNRVRYIRSESTLIARSPFKYLSIVAADAVIRGVDIEGCKYELHNAKLTREHQYAVSNEITGNCAFVSVRRGGAYIIESVDGK